MQPTWLINQAIAAAETAQREHYHALERPIAQFLTLYYNSKVESHKHRKREDFELYGPPAPNIGITPNAGAAFFRLGERGLVPGWAMIEQVLPDIRNAAAKGTVPGFYALVGKRAILLCPIVHKDMISCDYALIGKGPSNEVITVRNPDTEEEYKIEVDQDERSVLTGPEARFKRIDVGKPLELLPKLPTVTR